MNIKDILSDCVLKLGYGSRIDLTKSELTDEEQKLSDILLRCTNLIYSEICTKFFPNKVKEKVTLVDNKLMHDSLKQKYVYAITLKHNGIAKIIKQYPSYIESNFSGGGVLEYVCVPEKLTLDSYITDIIPSWLMTNGVLTEYCYANNLLDMANQYEIKYNEGISWLKCRGTSKYLKARRWL